MNSQIQAPVLVHQAAAVPFRNTGDGLEFCLITSSAGRWKFPKGFIDSGESFADTALKEADEEAGLHGHIWESPLGYYEITKYGQQLTVVAMLMEVATSKRRWLEKNARQRRWVNEQKARKLICESMLHDVLDEALTRITGR